MEQESSEVFENVMGGMNSSGKEPRGFCLKSKLVLRPTLVVILFLGCFHKAYRPGKLSGVISFQLLWFSKSRRVSPPEGTSFRASFVNFVMSIILRIISQLSVSSNVVLFSGLEN
jgi:hypothetical protein